MLKSFKELDGSEVFFNNLQNRKEKEMKEIPIQLLMFNSRNIFQFLNRCPSHSRLPPIKGESSNSYKINTFNNVHTIIKHHGKEWVHILLFLSSTNFLELVIVTIITTIITATIINYK